MVVGKGEEREQEEWEESKEMEEKRNRLEMYQA